MALLTVTWPDLFVRDPTEWTRSLDCLRDRLRRSHPDLAAVWVKEMAPRLSGDSAGLYAPHVHAGLYGPPVESEGGRGALSASLAGAWNGIVAAGDDKHLVKGIQLEQARNREATRFYLVACDKRATPEQRAAVLAQYPAGVGRSWGVWNKRALPVCVEERVELTSDEADAVEAAMCAGANERYREVGRPRRLHPTGRSSLTLSVPDVSTIMDAANVESERSTSRALC